MFGRVKWGWVIMIHTRSLNTAGGFQNIFVQTFTTNTTTI